MKENLPSFSVVVAAVVAAVVAVDGEMSLGMGIGVLTRIRRSPKFDTPNSLQSSFVFIVNNTFPFTLLFRTIS